MVRSFKEYQLLTAEDYNTLKIRHDNAVDRVRSTAAYIDEAEMIVRNTETRQHEIDEWEAYIKCDTLPKAYEPEAIRKYYFQTFYFEDKDIETTVNWLLAVDERSVLTQDIDAKNMTRSNLQKHRRDFGKQYDQCVSDTMKILHRIERFLEKPTHKLHPRITKDIEWVKFESFNQVNQYINKLTYRILCSEDAYMDEIDATSAEYLYGGKQFDIHLWTFKNVPLNLDPATMPSHMINLTQIKVNIVMPFSVLCNNVVLRGLRCHFDHFSDHVRFYGLPPIEKMETKLADCLEAEWNATIKLRDEIRKDLIKQRAEFEEIMRIKTEEEELKKKRRKAAEEMSGAAETPAKAKAEQKPKRNPREPQNIPMGLYPYVKEDFLIREQEDFVEGMQGANPETFFLNPREVNLRKYQILGGVYQLNYVGKPKSVDLPSLVMTWYTPGKPVQIKDVKVDLTDGDRDVSKFFQITFTIPKYCCHWGEPLPCLFEEGESHALKTVKNPTMVVDTNLMVTSPIIINDFNIQELFDKTRMYNFIDNIIPRVISSFRFPADFVSEDDGKKGRVVVRAKLTADQELREKELAMQRKMLSMTAQNSPERLFPLFKKVLPVIITPIQADDENEESASKPRVNPYENFSEFYEAVNAIKENYKRTNFKDNKGNPYKVLAEEYSRNIQGHRVSTISSRIDLQQSSKNSLTKSSDTKRERARSSLVGNPVELTKQSTTLSHHLRHGTHTKGGRRSSRPRSEELKSLALLDDGYLATKWSAANILKSEFNAAERKLTIWTDRLGTFGMAYYRYQHFPFQNWYMSLNEENPEEVQFVVESMYAVFRFYVSTVGYRVIVSDFTKYEKSRNIYFAIKEPTADLKFIKQQLQQKFLNIFPEPDFAFYTTGYFSEKHLATEYHTYKCMTLFSTSLRFVASVWNKLSTRRVMVLRFGEIPEPDEELLEIQITPNKVSFVDIKEVCTDLDTINLEYIPTWRNLERYVDLSHLIHSNFNGAEDMRLTNPYTIFYLNNLLQAVRPLSCS